MYSTTILGMILITAANILIVLVNVAVTNAARKKTKENGQSAEKNGVNESISLQETPLAYDLASRKAAREAEFMRRANEILSRNLRDPDYTQSRFCMDLHMERSGVFRIMKRNTGYAVNAYMMHKRVELAKTLISEDPEKNDREISEMSGFKDSGQFRRQFVKNTGFMPADYRRLVIAKSERR